MRSCLFKVFLIVVFSIYSCDSVVQDARHPEKWFEELERQWIAEGRWPELSEDEILFRRSNKRRLAEVEKMLEYQKDPRLRKKDLKDIANKVDKIGRPVMMHATLTQDYVNANKDHDKNDLTWDQKADKCDQWLDRMYYRVKEISCFPNETVSILITVKRDYEAEDVWEFLKTQRDIEELEWDDRIVYPYKLDEEL